jgi:hypothetical protein
MAALELSIDKSFAPHVHANNPCEDHLPKAFNPATTQHLQQDQVMTDHQFDQLKLNALRQEIQKQVQIQPPQELSTQQLLIEFVNSTEAIKTALLKTTLEHERTLSDEGIDAQKALQRLLSERRKTAIMSQEVNNLANMATALLSIFTIAIGLSMATSGIAPMIIPGSMMATSGALSLAGLAMEAMGFDQNYAKTVSGVGLAVGMLTTAVTGYLHPDLISQSKLLTVATTQALITGIAEFAEAQIEMTGSNLDADKMEEKRKQELIRIEITRVFQDLKQVVGCLSNGEEVSKMLKQQQDLIYLYASLQQMQG